MASGTERAIWALKDYLSEYGIEWEEHEECDAEVESMVDALLAHLRAAEDTQASRTRL